jgi:hypothetical protein
LPSFSPNPHPPFFSLCLLPLYSLLLQCQAQTPRTNHACPHRRRQRERNGCRSPAPCYPGSSGGPGEVGPPPTPRCLQVATCCIFLLNWTSRAQGSS